MRKLIIVAIACSTFGGMIGALVTAATQSQASPSVGAIAAAVQRVQDQSADRSLTSINTRLAKTDTTLGKTNAALAGLQTAISGDLTTDLGDVVNDLGTNGALAGAAHNLGVICAGTAVASDQCDLEATPAPTP